MNAMSQPLDLEHYWMPYTNNRAFKLAPRMVASAEGMYYTTIEGKKVLDGLATLWCVNAGHCRPKIVEAGVRTRARKACRRSRRCFRGAQQREDRACSKELARTSND